MMIRDVSKYQWLFYMKNLVDIEDLFFHFQVDLTFHVDIVLINTCMQFAKPCRPNIFKFQSSEMDYQLFLPLVDFCYATKLPN